MKITWNEFNGIEFLASILVTIILTYIVYRLKPSLQILNACWDADNKQIKIKIRNLSKSFDAVNLRIEVAVVEPQNRYTYHLNVDHTDFLILPRNKTSLDNEKVFKVTGISDGARIHLDNNETLQTLMTNRQLRIRIHSYHSFSGLGKVEEVTFKNLDCL